MNEKTFRTIAGIILSLAALLHVVRSVAGWDLVLNGFVIPVWVSILAFLIAGYLGLYAFGLFNKK